MSIDMRPRLKSTDKWGLFAVVAIVGENHQLGRIKEIETTVIDLECDRETAQRGTQGRISGKCNGGEDRLGE